ncbi:MAG: hypothetical protein GY811_06800 [Myxococcales bacterium]|nr:hypothetical protein [Myxococcales bacterium]
MNRDDLQNMAMYPTQVPLGSATTTWVRTHEEEQRTDATGIMLDRPAPKDVYDEQYVKLLETQQESRHVGLPVPIAYHSTDLEEGSTFGLAGLFDGEEPHHITDRSLPAPTEMSIDLGDGESILVPEDRFQESFEEFRDDLFDSEE